jgi:MFS family permease
MRHALAGVAIALVVSVLIAAMAGSVIGDLLGGTYGWRAGAYLVLMIYVVTGGVVLFVRVARHETRPLTVGRVGLWISSLWLWPLLLLARRQGGDGDDGRGDGGPQDKSPST